MGWKGAKRALEAELQGLEREDAHEPERQGKQVPHAVAAAPSEDLDRRVQRLRTIHTRRSPPIDWNAVLASPTPPRPEPILSRQRAVRSVMERFEPSLLDRLLRRAARAREELRAMLVEARAVDDAASRARLAAWERATRRWREDQELARGVLAGDTKALEKALLFEDHLPGMREFSANLAIKVVDAHAAQATLASFDLGLVPHEAQDHREGGRLPVRETPKRTYAALVQDFVCSAAVRMACEVLAVIPVSNVLVTVTAEMTNPSSGLLEETPILSALIPRETLAKLDLEKTEASELMKNFLHEMAFEAGRGFVSIQPLDSVPSSRKAG